MRCIHEEAAKAHFDAGGGGTLSMRVAYLQPRDPPSIPPDDLYGFTAHAAHLVEGARPAFDHCASQRGAHRETQATFSLAFSPAGVVQEVRIDDFSGDQELLRCAAAVLEQIAFPALPKPTVTLRQRVQFEAVP